MSDKQYKPAELFIDREPYSINKGSNDFYIQIAYKNLNAFQHPRLFIRKGKNKGVLRLNFCTYFTISIPDNFQTALESCRFLEIILSSPDNSEYVSRFAPVSHVLKFPEIYEMNLNSPKKENRTSENIPETENPAPVFASEEPEPDDNGGDNCGESEKNVEEEENFEHLTCLQSITGWMAEHNGFSMRIKKLGDHNFCLITDNISQFFLICCFENSGDWLADEEPYGGEYPLYFSASSCITSPIFCAAAVADYWFCRTGFPIKPIVLFDDALQVINTRDMSLEWMTESSVICSGNRRSPEEVIKKFDL